MADLQCDYPGCTFSAKEKCGICGNIYCIRHILLTVGIYTCDLCIARADAERKAEIAREQAERAIANAIKRDEHEKAEAWLEAYRRRRKANRKKRVTLARVGTSMIAGSVLIYLLVAVSSPNNTPPTPPNAPLQFVVVEFLFWGGIIALLAILAFRD